MSAQGAVECLNKRWQFNQLSKLQTSPTTIGSHSETINDDYRLKESIFMMTNHARRESVKRYTSVQLEAKKRLLEGKQGAGV